MTWVQHIQSGWRRLLRLSGSSSALQRLRPNLLVDRHHPPLARLRALRHPESFLWQMMPLVARSFAFCIACFPQRLAKALAVAYCYCRMLDTYEDLGPTNPQRIRAIQDFIVRFTVADTALTTPSPLALPPIERLPQVSAQTPSEACYLLLLERAPLIDALYRELAVPHQRAIAQLVKAMGEGMIWASHTLSQQGGKLESLEQLSRYCWHVLGTALLFIDELVREDCLQDPRGQPPRRMRVIAEAAECMQLANITRDISADHQRGISYHPDLTPQNAPIDGELSLREARRALLRRGLLQGPSLCEYVQRLPFARCSVARGAMVMFVLTTHHYYYRAAQQTGFDVWPVMTRIRTAKAASIWFRAVLSQTGADRGLTQLRDSFRRAGNAATPSKPVHNAAGSSTFVAKVIFVARATQQLICYQATTRLHTVISHMRELRGAANFRALRSKS